MDESGDENDNGWTFSWTFTTSFILQKKRYKKFMLVYYDQSVPWNV